MELSAEVVSKNTRDKIAVRSAVPQDSSDAAKLIFMTGEGIFNYLFYPAKEKSLATLGRLFEIENEKFKAEFGFKGVYRMVKPLKLTQSTYAFFARLVDPRSRMLWMALSK